ncbi:conserved hypothetical protein [Frankia canadensis]|uniref:Nucleic-acid-binding protein containing a Zn-ribbon n=1 Tax=Frankia canadensis TaxID=1836972 RepID=A0A2I2KI22_9ACTN|nr:OB-fold domain-containing protein [Frankia canadensis]SNQ45304.1 conserved hypothetical protein [Frankia canadensis]SOU52594.1 conserved hypothetical protein [Frankia canadensis]
MTQPRLLPDVKNPLAAPFWAGLREHRLVVQRCPACGTKRYPAAPLCTACLTPGGEWVDVAPEGELWSYVVYRRALSPAFADDVPYPIGLVEVDDARLQILSRIDAPPDSISIGARMRARFTPVTETVTLLSWAPAEESAAAHD